MCMGMAFWDTLGVKKNKLNFMDKDVIWGAKSVSTNKSEMVWSHIKQNWVCLWQQCIKQYDSTVYVGVRAIVAPTAKNHPKDIVRDKNHLYRIALVHLQQHQKMHLKQENNFRWLDIEFLKISKNSKFHLTACLTTCLIAWLHSQA